MDGIFLFLSRLHLYICQNSPTSIILWIEEDFVNEADKWSFWLFLCEIYTHDELISTPEEHRNAMLRKYLLSDKVVCVCPMYRLKTQAKNCINVV